MISRLLFVFIACFFALNSLQAQSRIGKKEQHQIQKTCEAFQRQNELLITNFEASVDSMKMVCTEHVFNHKMILREFYERMQYDLVFDEEKIIELELKDSVGCIVQVREQTFKINLKKESDRWKVSGFDNHEIDQADLDSIRIEIDRRYKEEDVKDSIKEIAKDFVQGWSEIRESGESDLLRSHSTKEVYDFFLKRVEYDHLHGYGHKPLEVEEVGRVHIHGDTADCRVRIRRMGSAYLTFLLIENQWKIAGTDDKVFTSVEVEKMKSRIANFLELAEFEKYIDDLNSKLEPFFKTGNSSQLKEIATDNFINQLEIHRRLFGTIDTSFLGVRGLYGSTFPSSDYAIYGDSAYYDYFYDSLRFIKVNDKWMFDELYVSKEIANKYLKAQETFEEFNQLIHLSYSYYNSLDEDTPPPPAPAARVTNEEEYARVKNYHRLSKYHDKITYESGYEQLQKDIDSLVKKYAAEISFTGTIFVEFDVDNFGIAHNIQALDFVGSKQASLAIKITEELSNWLPNNNRQASLTNMVIPIQF
jgi:hypothetical protein